MNATWSCTDENCVHETSDVAVRKMLDKVQSEIEQLDSLGSDPQAIELRENIIHRVNMT